MKVLGKRSVASVVKGLLDVAFYGAAAILALAVCLLVASPFMDLSGAELDIPVSFSVDSGTLAGAAPSTDVKNARIQGARGSLILPVRGTTMLLTPFMAIVVMLGVALWVLALFRGLFRTLSDGHPFVPANARRIRWIAWAVIVGEVARAAVVYFANRFAATHFTPNGLTFDARPDLNLFTIVSGVIILVISEVFRAGTRLDEDQSLTV